MKTILIRAVLVAVAFFAGKVRAAESVYSSGMGYSPTPTLPPPDKEIIPTVDIAPAKGWALGKTPVPAAGLTVNALATYLEHPRTLYILPNGDVLVAEKYHGGAFVGQHGSWNRKPPAGYKVIFVPYADGRPNGMPEDVLTGFLDQDGNALGRPVGVAIDRRGALLVADDVGNVIWHQLGPMRMCTRDRRRGKRAARGCGGVAD